ncbi:MAG: agmatine deiminase family protein [Planctomycetes bacterium]|nr:agmatine deiminase family protein [Planctomycetota bacterium]
MTRARLQERKRQAAKRGASPPDRPAVETPPGESHLHESHRSHESHSSHESAVPPDQLALSRRLPAEFEPTGAVWLAWPHNAEDWPGKIDAVRWAFAELLRLVTREVPAILLVNDEAVEADARRALEAAHVSPSQVEFARRATDRGWLRDIAPEPLAVAPPPPAVGARGRSRRTGGDAGRRREAIVWSFNGWAKYDNWRRDAGVARFLCERHGFTPVPAVHRGRPVVMEGGAIDTDGRGTLLATRECLLSAGAQARNPGFTAADYEALFARYLGARRVIWLEGGVAGDDTNGHVDDCARFVAPGVVVAAVEPDRGAANHAPRAENLARLVAARDARGRPPRVVEVPLPEPVSFAGQRLPASYANFLICNETVIVPTFNDPADGPALERIAAASGRRAVGLFARDLVLGLGAVHCLTRQMPEGGPSGS